MRTAPTLLLASACALMLGPAASARPLHHRHHRVAVRAIYEGSYVRYAPPASAGYGRDDGGGFNAGAAQIPARGTYDNYEGPGATVLRRSLESQYEPGLAQELAPDGKQTATGGPSGGLPGFGGGR